jgi:hypothetical protein
MSLRPQDPSMVPKETRRVARAAFPKGTLCLRIADALGPVYQDSQFEPRRVSRRPVGLSLYAAMGMGSRAA